MRFAGFLLLVLLSVLAALLHPLLVLVVLLLGLHVWCWAEAVAQRVRQRRLAREAMLPFTIADQQRKIAKEDERLGLGSAYLSAVNADTLERLAKLERQHQTGQPVVQVKGNPAMASAFDPQHVRTPEDCPVCWRLVGGPKLYPGEKPELAPMIRTLHYDAMDHEGDDAWPPSRQLPPPWK